MMLGKIIIGALMIVVGVILGFYIGLWVCFIGGIVQIINEIKSPQPVVAISIATGIVKIVFAGAAGCVSVKSLILPGFFIISRS